VAAAAHDGDHCDEVLDGPLAPAEQLEERELVLALRKDTGGGSVEWSQSYVLNTQSEEKNTVIYSYLACFMNTFSSNTYVSMSYYRVQQAEHSIRIRVAAPQEYVNTYSTCRVPVEWSQQTIPQGAAEQLKEGEFGWALRETKGYRRGCEIF